MQAGVSTGVLPAMNEESGSAAADKPANGCLERPRLCACNDRPSPRTPDRFERCVAPLLSIVYRLKRGEHNALPVACKRDGRGSHRRGRQAQKGLPLNTCNRPNPTASNASQRATRQQLYI